MAVGCKNRLRLQSVPVAAKRAKKGMQEGKRANVTMVVLKGAGGGQQRTSESMRWKVVA